MAFKSENNVAFCFKQEGKDGYSAIIKLDDGQEFWCNVYDKQGAKGPYKLVKLNSKKAKPAQSRTDQVYAPDESDVPF